MDDIKSFEDEADLPVEGESARLQEAPNESRQEPEAEEVLSFEEIERRYVVAVNAMHEDACSRQAGAVFVDVLTWKLASIAVTCGAEAAGDIVRRFGGHITRIAESDRAQREAEKAKKEGRKPH